MRSGLWEHEQQRADQPRRRRAGRLPVRPAGRLADGRRDRLASHEAPAIKQRSRVRHLPRRLDELRVVWPGSQCRPEANA